MQGNQLCFLAFARVNEYIAAKNNPLHSLNPATTPALSVEEALRIVLESVGPLKTERASLSHALDRILATDIVANDDIPSFDNSSMDGFAVRAEDVVSADAASPISLRLKGEIAAGSKSRQHLQAMTTTQVMTGAPIPDGATAVIEQELVISANGSIRVSTSVQEGRNIRRRGEDIRSGQTIIQKGAQLKPSHVGVLASLGIASMDVYRRPRVAFLTTGNELVGIKSPLATGKIRNSNEYSMSALLRESGCYPVGLGIARDKEANLKKKLTLGLKFDALLTCGGISVGKYDLVLKVLEKLGVERKFWKVNMRPGGPFAFGLFRRGKLSVPVFCLPGNPVSSVVTFIQFVRPGLQKMMGFAAPAHPLRLSAKIEHDFHKNDQKRHFSRGILRNEGGTLFVRTTGSQSSGILSSLVSANCLIIVPEDKVDLRAGEGVEVELL